jgi:uncharacterized protein YraI
MKRNLAWILIGLLLVMGFGLTVSTQAQNNTPWDAAYFNNSNLSGNPTARHSVAGVNFNWGSGSPASGVGVDNWSARFYDDPFFNAGRYRFTVLADDGVRLYVRGQLLIDTFNNTRPNQQLVADVDLPTGNSDVLVEFREFSGNAFISLSWQQISSTVPTVPPTNPVPGNGQWLAQYFNNRNLSNNPTTTVYETSPTHDWGTAAPANGIPADNFSVRWSGTQYFNAGAHRLTVTVDDGVRVYINGVLILNEWHGAPTIATYTRDIQLSAGNANIVIEYYDEIGIARIQFVLVPIGQNPPPQNPTGATVTINTGMLNMRSTPAIANNVITRLPRGTSYQLIGRTADNRWYQIVAGQNTGWVSAPYVIATNANAVPVVSGQVSTPTTPTTPTGYVLRASANVNIRSGANVSFARLGILPYNATASIVARNSSNSWWLINYNGVTGWVNGNYVNLPVIDFNRVPVV